MSVNCTSGTAGEIPAVSFCTLSGVFVDTARNGRSATRDFSDHAQLSDMELVVVRSKKLQFLLVEELGATGQSLNERMISVGSMFSKADIEKFRYVVLVRNRVINEVLINDLTDRNRFVQVCTEAEAAIKVAKYNREKRAPFVVTSSTGGGKSKKSGCFIATAVYGDPEYHRVMLLRDFRDRRLLTNIGGRTFVSVYYAISPPIARWLQLHPNAAARVRRLLDHVTNYLDKSVL